MARFDGKLTIGVATAQNLMTLLVAAGYRGSAMANALQIESGAQPVFIGNSSAVNATTGRSIAGTGTHTFEGAMIDLAALWLFITLGDTIEVAAQSI